MSIWFMTAGILCGATAAVLTITLGYGWFAAFAAYSVIGSVGLVSMALSGVPDVFSDQK